jgi:Ca-activated chloride channel family protein
VQASVKLDHSVLAIDGEHDVHALIEIVVPERPDEENRVPLELALVLDGSGSMAGRKLEVAKRCASWLLTRLRATDQLAVVTYDDEVRLLAPLAPGTSETTRALSLVQPGGQTNLSGGAPRAGGAAGRNGNAVRKILLLSDGLANVEVTDRPSLAALAASAYKQGVGTTTIGFGTDFDEDLMTALADAGGGAAHFAETPDAAPAIFAQELEGLTQVVAQNVSIEIRPHAAVQVLGVLNEYPAVPVDGGVQVELGDAYAGERRRVVLAFHVPHLAALGPVAVAELALRYVSVGDEIAHHELTIPIVANVVSADEASRAVPDAEVREEVLVLRAANARDEAIRLADAGEFDAAQATLFKVAEELRDAGLDALIDEAAVLDTASGMVTSLSYDGSSRKNLNYDSWNRRRGRQSRS